MLPERPGSFGRTGVGVGGLETFWDELLGKKYYMSEKSFFYQIWGVVNFGFRGSEAPKRPILEPTPMRPHSGPFLGPFAGGKILVRREKKIGPLLGPPGARMCHMSIFLTKNIFLRRLVF